MPSIGLAKEGCFFHTAQSYGWRAMFYTYVIESLSHPDQRYIGHTVDLKQRLTDHNAGKRPHTSKFMPWKIKLYVAFETIGQAQHFEKYLRSGSGHVFAKRHLWKQSERSRYFFQRSHLARCFRIRGEIIIILRFERRVCRWDYSSRQRTSPLWDSNL
jgi:putative endonuclease